MLVTDMIQSKFLRKEDVDDDFPAIIKSLSVEDIDSKNRYALHFRETSKAMVMNNTTIRVLEKAFGRDTDQWIGKGVVIYVDPNVVFQGRVVGGLRLKPQRPVKATEPALVATRAGESFSDNIPY